jgi:hypothetical protein
MVQVLQRRSIGDGSRKKRPSFGGLSQFVHPNAIAALRQQLEVGEHLVPVHDGLVGADRMAEVTLGRRYGRGREARGQQQAGNAENHSYILTSDVACQRGCREG